MSENLFLSYTNEHNFNVFMFLRHDLTRYIIGWYTYSPLFMIWEDVWCFLSLVEYYSKNTKVKCIANKSKWDINLKHWDLQIALTNNDDVDLILYKMLYWILVTVWSYTFMIKRCILGYIRKKRYISAIKRRQCLRTFRSVIKSYLIKLCL